jgi:murein DD-endopeptidase MepM/ murein hydrolase activator NlpD
MSEQIATLPQNSTSTADDIRVKRLKTEAMPQPGTFAQWGQHLNHEYEESTVNYYESRTEQAWSRAEAIAADKRLTGQARGEDISAVLREAQEEIEGMADHDLERIIADQDKARAASKRSMSVSPDEAAALNYLRESLTAQVAAKAITHGDVLSLWKDALASGDKAALRVFYDNGAALLTAALGGKQIVGQDGRAFTGPTIDDLRQQTDIALRTPEQAAAAAKVLKLEATRMRVVSARNAAKRRFERPTIGRDGSLQSAASQPTFRL